MTTAITHRDLSGTAPADINEGWESAMSALYMPVSVDVDPSAIDAAPNFLTRYELDDLALVDLSCSRCRVASTTKATGNLADHLAVIFVAEGAELVSDGDHQAGISRGELVLWDPRRDAQFVVERHALKRNLLIPRSEIQAVLGRSIDGEHLSLGGPCLRLLASLIPTLTDSVDGLSDADTRSVRNVTVELVAGALRGSAGVPSGARAQLRSTVLTWIERHLREDLSPARLAVEHSISIRTLNRLFAEQDETLSGFVRRRRLERAKHDVLHSDLSLTDVAYRWRFSDGSHFARRFTEHFGTPPSELRRQLR